MEQETAAIKNLETLKNRLEVMVVGRLRKRDDIIEAVKTQERLSKKSGSWRGAEEIRKWREKR